MATPAHKNNTQHFGDLKFDEQARSITAMINNLKNAIDRHAQHPDATPETKEKCTKQVYRLLGRLLD